MNLSDAFKCFMNLVTEPNNCLNIHDGLMFRNKLKSLLGMIEFAYVNSNIVLFQLQQKDELYCGALTDKLEIASKLLLDNQINLENASAYFLNYENTLIYHLMVREHAEYQKGLSSGNIMLEKYLFCSEFEDIENHLKLPIVKRWYKNFERITMIRKQKLENQITWDEMKGRINKILRIK